MKLFIESIEGGTYLANVADNHQQTLVRDKANNPLAFRSLNQIKAHFSQAEFEQVWLRQATPYDEMCGLDESNEKLEMIIDFH